ncbi:pyridoxal-phosphate dependent enzyme [Solicola gregarius]|uniref:Pyridoxal-phosphate dependent enzyme n=1 Tax=Solicola gregarius TaxID=2908642 RepID=A0AA46TK75_9ACTN|nr:pyridoxal-phosphate dependent enzyme [Solicola gregarius]UYM06826.1 pyridoxal-phosphate dependent enzyme [Solicola gregarius]
MTFADPSPSTIATARTRIAPHVRPLATRRSESRSTLVDGDVVLALENEQPTGSFKIRGAANAVLSHLERGVTGITTASTGNHARAVAHIALAHGLPVRAYVSRDVSDGRVRGLHALGSEVDPSAADQTEAIERAQAYADEHGHAFVPPFDDPDVISGQGTLGLDVADALPGLDIVVVPVSGGGLASGLAIAVKTALPVARVIGVCAERAPAMRAALDAGHPVDVPERETVADSLRGDLGPDNRYTFRLVRDFVDEVATIGEDSILEAQHELRRDGLAVEGAAAAAAAYVSATPAAFAGLRTAVIVSGAADDARS